MAWRLAQSRGMETVFVAPGNAGTALEVGDLAGDQLRTGGGVARHHPVQLDQVDAGGAGGALGLAGGEGEQDAERRGDVLPLAGELGERAAAKVDRAALGQGSS